MKILSVRIKNLASLEGETFIDFSAEPLCSAGIFAITGATGAGKSTILDAICLALYCQTPRFNKAGERDLKVTDLGGNTLGQNDVRAILRDGTAEGFAEVAFAGVDGNHYLSKWSVRRARGRVEGAVQADAVELKNLSDGVPFGAKKTETLKEIERLAGLNFDQFTRSVLLAQGDFTAFLKATKDEKASLLEKLTGTHIYSRISQKVFARCKTAEEEKKELELEMSHVPVLPQEEADKLQEEAAHVQVILHQQHAQKQLAVNALQWYKQAFNLKEFVVKAEKQLEKSLTEFTGAAGRFEKIRLLESVSQAAVLVEKWRDESKSLTEKQALILRQRKEAETLQHALEEQQQLSKEAESMHQQAVRDRDAAGPLLREAEKLDILLLGKKDLIDEEIISLKKIQQEKEKAQEDVNENERKAGELAVQMRKAQEWQQQNAGRKGIAENEAVIKEKLEQAGQRLEQLTGHQKEYQQHLEEAGRCAVRKEAAEKNIADYLQKEAEKAAVIKDLEEQLAKISVSEVQKSLSAANEAITEILSASAVWETLYRGRQDVLRMERELAAAQKELAAAEELSAANSKELQRAKAAKEVLAKLLDRLKTEQSESVEKLRGRLKEGYPCAVCGSVDHPYAVSYESEAALSSVEEEFLQENGLYEEALRKDSRLSEAMKRWRESIPLRKAELDEKKVVVADRQQKWEGFGVSAKVAETEQEEVADFLAVRVKLLRDEVQELLAAEKQFHDISAKLAMLQKELAKIGQQLFELENHKKDIERKKQSAEENAGRLLRLLEDGELHLRKAKEDLKQYFEQENWFENWKANPAKFTNTLSTFGNMWRRNEEDIRQLRQELELMKTRVENSGVQLREKTKRVQVAEERLGKLKEEQDAFLVKRREILGGEPVHVLENRFKKAVEKWEKTKSDIRNRKEEMQRQTAVCASSVERFEKEEEALRESIAHQHKKIATWLQAHEPTTSFEELQELLEVPAEWRKKEKATLEAIEKARNEAFTVLGERKNALREHEKTRQEETPELELKEKLEALENSLRTQEGRSHEIRILLKNHELEKKKVEKLIAEIAQKEITSGYWSKLNELIGSQDGKKFRQIAQEYTLDILLEYANVELKKLSNRYSLQRIPGTLGLQVCDHDMGDELRTVYSLSGGEAFLLSLALALGLSALSSNQMRVESLFIDEGFGALDPETLNVAMDALERLYGEGRKVGVISHVQEMTERIPVQIKVRKVASGRSVAEVTGG